MVSNLVIFHLSDIFSSCVVNEENHFVKEATVPVLPESDPETYTSSEDAGIFDKLTVSAREMRVMAKVALSNGSSQQGNARLAAVGYR